jgi:hypothetical protein
MGIVLDAVAQLLIYRQVHPVAALVISPFQPELYTVAEV